MTPISFDSTAALRLGTLTGLRWFAVLGQFIVLMVVRFGFGFEVDLVPVLAIVAAGVAVNLYAHFSFSPGKPLSPQETITYLVFDTAQIGSILYFTGGLQNPFALWLIMQAMLASSSLPLRRALIVIGGVIVSLTLLAIWHQPMPWVTSEGFALPQVYNIGIWSALTLSVLFTSAYAYRVTSEHLKLSAALGATQKALSQEERLSALDGLAAAAAHELGTPLATIQVTAREMEHELPDGDLKEDAALLVQQTQRCQKILKRLSKSGQAGDAVHSMMSLDDVLQEAARPFAVVGSPAVRTRFDSHIAAIPDDLVRRPEIIYGLRNLIENAHKYASDLVDIKASWDETSVWVFISDDGPGIPDEMLMRLGEPYPRAAHQSPDGKGGLGLGFFIAQTLLERTGATLSFGNHKEKTGAWVRVKWPLVKLLDRPTSVSDPQAAEALAL